MSAKINQLSHSTRSVKKNGGPVHAPGAVRSAAASGSFNRYPLSRNHFVVEWGGTRIGFSEVSGLIIEVDAPVFRDGASPVFSNVTMPGMLRYPHVVLKRPVVPGDQEFYNWLATIRLNTVERRDVVIRLLNETHEPVMVWKLKNAFPVKLEYSSLDAQNSGPMLEILEITHEGLTVQQS